MRFQRIAVCGVALTSLVVSEAWVAPSNNGVSSLYSNGPPRKSANAQVEEPNTEVSSLLEKYQHLKESSMNTQIQYQREVVELKDELRRKESHLNFLVDEFKDEFQCFQSEDDPELVDGQDEESASEAISERAKTEVSSLLQKYQDLKESAVSQQIQHRREVVDLQEELREKESYFNTQVDELKKELLHAEQEAEEKAQKLLTEGAEREAKLRSELMEALVAESNEREKESQAAEREISSLLKNYQDLKESSAKAETKHKAEVAGLKDEMSKKESHYNTRMKQMKQELGQTQLQADRKVKNLEATSAARENQLRKELEAVVSQNQQMLLQFEELKKKYHEEIMDLEDRLEGEQDVRIKQGKHAEKELRLVREQARKTLSKQERELRRLKEEAKRALTRATNGKLQPAAQKNDIMQALWDLSKNTWVVLEEEIQRHTPEKANRK